MVAGESDDLCCFFMVKSFSIGHEVPVSLHKL